MISHVPAGATRLLDIGCGTGFFLAELLERHPGAVGLDISHDMLKVSGRYVHDARLVTGDAEQLPFGRAAFAYGAPIVIEESDDPSSAEAKIRSGLIDVERVAVAACASSTPNTTQVKG